MLRLMIQALKVAAVIVLAVVVLFTAQRSLTHYLDVASAQSGDQPITFTVQNNETVDSVSNRLQQDGLIRSATYFKLKMRLGNSSSQLKAGQFILHQGMSVDQIITALTTSESVKVIEVRFQEGWRAEEYADKLVAVGLISTPDQFLNAMKSNQWNFDFLTSRTDDQTLEGYLFPDTYQFRADATPDDVINTLLQNFNSKVPPDLRAKSQALGLNFNQVMIIASIVEREAVVPGERPIIASVYYNRMKQNMPLQADPTVQYSAGKAGDWWPKVTQAALDNSSNYNTYHQPGLPPSPICSPSLASIEAALNPSKTDYLYFVAKNDGSGSHAFATTYQEQLDNIQKYGGQ
ncbi:MAG TPA: endolytic transglycosylase MltG [Thermomicrobiaceae bacterium]|nr:endolytic transglycosylase MltG [Thermomicrobiaceae bacterium]